MTAGSIPVPTVVPLRVPAAGESKFNINTNTRVELRSAVPASESISIHYTINGTRPDPFNRSNHLHKSTFMYVGPFTLPAGKIVLKALACLPDGKESGVNTKTLHVTYVEPDENMQTKMEDNDISFRKTPQQSAPKASLTQSMNSSFTVKSDGGFPFPMEMKDPIITQQRKTAVPPKFSLTGSVKPMSELSYEINTNTNYPNIFGDYAPKSPQTAMRISRETDFLRCICCFAPRPADPSAKFCHECGYPVSPLSEKQLPPPEPGQMGQCIKCQSTVPLNTEKCVVCEFDLVEQFQPQATLRTAEKKKCAECFSFNPPSVTFCLKCEARLDDVSVVKIRNNIEKPPPNTSMFLGDDSMVTCSKCGRVNSADARFCDWCGSKPKKTSSLINCLKCTAANEPYARFCSTCGAVMEAPKRLDLRNTGKLMSGVSIKEAIKSLDSRATAAWLPMTAPVLTPAKKQTAAVQTQTVGLFYPSTKTLEKYLAEDETRRVFKAASLTQSMNSSFTVKSDGGFPFPMEMKDPIITQQRKTAVPPKFSLTGSVKPMSELSYEINTNTNYPNIFGDYAPKSPQTAMRISRETDFLRCICCFAPRPADPSAKFCHECGYPVSPLSEKQLPPPEPGQMGQCIKCQSTVPLNTEKCVVCEFDLVEQFQPQATLRTAEKKKCAECFSFNPPSVTFCLKCEARLDDVSVVKIRNNIEKPPPNTSMFLGDDSMVTCSKCGRVNSADARFCDWCGSKPKKTSSLINCLKCTAANEPYARFCSTCGAVMEAPKRLDLRNTGKLMSGVSIKEAIKSLDSRATAAWLPMTAPVLTPAKKQTAAVQTQTVGLFYPSTKTLEKYLAEDETRRVFKEEKKIPLSGVSPGKGYWRQNVDFITNHLKAHTQNDTDFRKMIGDPKLGKLMSATIHEDGHEFSLVLNFPIRSNKEHPDPFKGKNLSISKSTVVGVYPNLHSGGRSTLGFFEDDSEETEPSDVETAMSSFISQKDKDLLGNTKQKIKTKKKKPATAAKGGDVELLSATNRLLFAQLGPGGDGDVEIVKQLLSEQDVSLDSVNSKGESILLVAVKNQRKDCIMPLIDAGADVNRKEGPNGNTSLHEAVLLGNNGQSIVEILLLGGANPNRKNDKGQTPYSIATEKAYENIITALAVNMGQDMLQKLAKSNSHDIDNMVY